MSKHINRRNALKTLVVGSGALAVPHVEIGSKKSSNTTGLKGNINHSVCQWCFSSIPLETLAQKAKEIGLAGIDLIGAEGWDTLKKYGLTSTMCYGDLEGASTRDLSKGWWGVALCKALNSFHFKLLYDIYHMQIMEGDVIRTIRDNIDYYGHFHTAGVPGRNEIDESQELFYPAIMEAIVEAGFKGYVAQEFIPKDRTEEGLRSLEDAVRLCDV
ncbi:MAG: hydroxypyruvate isomerase [Flavobacteriia bacterium]|nr:hydroxypyruvate isomerase [Flavobacteriia bacterium]